VKQPIVIFGSGDIAELADFYFTHDSEYDVVAFSVDESYRTGNVLRGRPLVPFEQVQAEFPPARCGFFVAVSYAKLNSLRDSLRAEKAAVARAKGYRLVSYLSSRATVFPNFEPGPNCFILEDNTIQPFARVGANVTLWSGNHIGHHSVIEDDVFLASHVVVSGGVTIGRGSFVGVNVTVRDHITIGRLSAVRQTGQKALIHSPDPWASVVVSITIPLSRSTSVV
jgi:sugar O-acyltransferase (sialic acid O-acetyltransferase NeuD family)